MHTYVTCVHACMRACVYACMDTCVHAQMPRIVLLDVGMVARLTRQEAGAFIGLLHAMGAGNGVAAAHAVLRFAAKQEVCVGATRVRAFATDMDSLFNERCRGFGTAVEFGSVLRGVLGLARKHSITLEANYMTLVRNAL